MGDHRSEELTTLSAKYLEDASTEMTPVFGAYSKPARLALVSIVTALTIVTNIFTIALLKKIQGRSDKRQDIWFVQFVFISDLFTGATSMLMAVIAGIFPAVGY